MIWVYAISLVLALIWFLVFRHVAYKSYSSNKYEFVEISRGMILISFIFLLIPIMNLVFFILGPTFYLLYLDSENWEIRLQFRENDSFSEKIKTIIQWLKGSAFILILFTMVDCIPVENNSNCSIKESKKINYTYPDANYVNKLTLDKIAFEDNGHDMIYYEGYNSNFCVIHSPNCKCRTEHNSILGSDLSWTW